MTAARARRAITVAALAAALAAGLAACGPGLSYSPPVTTSFQPCAPSQGHPVQDNSTGQWRCEP